MTIVLGFCHPHRSMQTSAPTDADIRTDRRRHPHRPMQMSAPTDADVRTDRRTPSEVRHYMLILSRHTPNSSKI
ncbi:hypothetical protein [Leyella stercorea]|uniref:hypothetical protein n=1 Tax=Leyella stercorea TaxID=363265 RepID=UPI0026670E78|nr:hypothetical protein [Leyella stercorea]